MKRAKVFVDRVYAADLEEIVRGSKYRLIYREGYRGEPVSLTMPLEQKVFVFDHFPPYFEGLLPEGAMLESLLRLKKIDAADYFEQLMQVGKEMVGSVSVERDL